jgi:hypothetical protein
MFLSMLELGVDETEPFAGKQSSGQRIDVHRDSCWSHNRVARDRLAIL